MLSAVSVGHVRLTPISWTWLGLIYEMDLRCGESVSPLQPCGRMASVKLWSGLCRWAEGKKGLPARSHGLARRLAPFSLQTRPPAAPEVTASLAVFTWWEAGWGLLAQTNPGGLARQDGSRVLLRREQIWQHTTSWTRRSWVGGFFSFFFLTPFWFFSSLGFVKVGMSSFLGTIS